MNFCIQIQIINIDKMFFLCNCYQLALRQYVPFIPNNFKLMPEITLNNTAIRVLWFTLNYF